MQAAVQVAVAVGVRTGHCSSLVVDGKIVDIVVVVMGGVINPAAVIGPVAVQLGPHDDSQRHGEIAWPGMNPPLGPGGGDHDATVRVMPVLHVNLPDRMMAMLPPRKAVLRQCQSDSDDEAGHDQCGSPATQEEEVACHLLSGGLESGFHGRSFLVFPLAKTGPAASFLRKKLYKSFHIKALYRQREGLERSRTELPGVPGVRSVSCRGQGDETHVTD